MANTRAANSNSVRLSPGATFSEKAHVTPPSEVPFCAYNLMYTTTYYIEKHYSTMSINNNKRIEQAEVPTCARSIYSIAREVGGSGAGCETNEQNLKRIGAQSNHNINISRQSPDVCVEH